jgi:hypothetical protein
MASASNRSAQYLSIIDTRSGDEAPYRYCVLLEAVLVEDEFTRVTKIPRNFSLVLPRTREGAEGLSL